MKIKLLILFMMCSFFMNAQFQSFQFDATQATNMQVVKRQVTADSTVWAIAYVFVGFLDAADSLQAVRHIKTVQDTILLTQIKVRRAAIDAERQKLDSLLVQYERTNNKDVTEGFDTTTIKQVIGTYSMKLGNNAAVNVRLNRNLNIVQLSNSAKLGTWKLINDNPLIIVIYTSDYEATLAYNKKTKAFEPVDRSVKLTLTKN